jgi:ribosome-binding protein aMBF1 (putative translation factor)
MPTGYQLRAARSLIGWQQKDLAKAAGLHPGVMNRMEKAGKRRVGGIVKNLEAVLDALEKHGVEITEDGVRLINKKPRR